jgi:hypothetical protein
VSGPYVEQTEEERSLEAMARLNGVLEQHLAAAKETVVRLDQQIQALHRVVMVAEEAAKDARPSFETAFLLRSLRAVLDGPS